MTFWVALPAFAMTQALKFETNKGYLVQTTFSYDENKVKHLIREHGRGQTEVLNNLQVSFYQPSGELIATYDNIVQGVSQGTYLEFNFDPVTKQLVGNLDIGGEAPGEIYLKGEKPQELWLVQVDSSGQEQAIAKIINE